MLRRSSIPLNYFHERCGAADIWLIGNEAALDCHQAWRPPSAIIIPLPSICPRFRDNRLCTIGMAP